MWPAEHTHFHQNMTFDPIKDGTLGAASPKNNRHVDFTKIHLGIFTVTGPFSKTLGNLMFPMCITLQTVYHHIKLTYER